MTSPFTHVFVYGTLRRGQLRDINLLRPAPIFISAATLFGTLYQLGDYPGVRLGGSGRVHGEVYQITPELERQLDEIEEVWPQPTGEYAKQAVRVKLAGADGVEFEQVCLVYEIAEDQLDGKRVIASGDWLKR
jgi:gamma-glutamylcyclotransferase (GGCT)/AIG2-like uncharacterized protein YtfP